MDDPVCNQPMRLSARAALLAEVQYLRERADQLEALAKVVPEDEAGWPPGAGHALWSLLLYSTRR